MLFSVLFEFISIRGIRIESEEGLIYAGKSNDSTYKDCTEKELPEQVRDSVREKVFANETVEVVCSIYRRIQQNVNYSAGDNRCKHGVAGAGVLQI